MKRLLIITMLLLVAAFDTQVIAFIFNGELLMKIEGDRFVGYAFLWLVLCGGFIAIYLIENKEQA